MKGKSWFQLNGDSRAQFVLYLKKCDSCAVCSVPYWKVIPGPNLFYIWRNVIPVQCAPLKGDSCAVCPTKRWFLCSVPYWKVIPVQCAILKGDSWVQLTKLIIKLFMILNPVLSSSLFIFHNTTLFYAWKCLYKFDTALYQFLETRTSDMGLDHS